MLSINYWFGADACVSQNGEKKIKKINLIMNLGRKRRQQKTEGNCLPRNFVYFSFFNLETENFLTKTWLDKSALMGN